MPDKLTDNEIVKALELCGDEDASCEKCPFLKDDFCKFSLSKNALDLIKSLQAENERLKTDVLAKEEEYNDMLEQRNSVEKYLETAKAEAYKEFAEKLKKESYERIDLTAYVEVNDIDDLLKELVGEGK